MKPSKTVYCNLFDVLLDRDVLAGELYIRPLSMAWRGRALCVWRGRLLLASHTQAPYTLTVADILAFWEVVAEQDLVEEAFEDTQMEGAPTSSTHAKLHDFENPGGPATAN